MSKPLFSGPLTGRHVLIMLLSLFFVVASVNGYFIYQANKTWRGLESETAYEDGLAYNRTLREAAAQQALGWQPELTLTRHEATVTLKDRDGNPVLGLTPTAIVSRPADGAFDQTIHLTSKGDGLYAGDVILSQAGQWLLRIEARLPDGQPYRIEERFMLP